ncbi:MAG: winged helix-turn-helix transcriptional regulator [Candidatus Omnitrophica bacterium]|nr:winged helix-turn-helix transcriptional regulator [Candidatus Omnitrophota bacterium]
MKLKNCKKCQKLFVNVLGKDICQECCEKEEGKHKEILRYLNDNPSASIKEICESIKVSEKSIIELIKNKRVTLDISVEYACEVCGRKIKTGRVCVVCKGKIERELGKAVEKLKKEEGEMAAKDLATKYALELRKKKGY